MMSFFTRRAFTFINENPGRFASLCLKRVALFWSPHEISNNKAIAFEKENSALFRYVPGFPLVLALALAAGSSATADGGIEFFEREIRPLLAEQCFACHSAKAPSVFANLRLDSRAGVLKGSDAGPVVLPGQPESSRLMRALRGEINPVQWLEMPPMLINILKQHTGEEPCSSLIRDAKEAMERPKILSASLSLSYQYADVGEMGASFVAVADGDIQAAKGAACWMA